MSSLKYLGKGILFPFLTFSLNMYDFLNNKDIPKGGDIFPLVEKKCDIAFEVQVKLSCMTFYEQYQFVLLCIYVLSIYLLIHVNSIH